MLITITVNKLLIFIYFIIQNVSPLQFHDIQCDSKRVYP